MQDPDLITLFVAHLEKAGIRYMITGSIASSINVAPPEYIIIHKLDFYREGGSQKHLRDIAGIIEQQPLNQSFLQPTLESLGLIPE